MDWDGIQTDTIERQLVDDERLIARLRARQMAGLAELDTRQIALADGSRSLSEWVAARLDVGPDTAKTLVRTMRRLHDRPDLQTHLYRGDTTFDRVEAVSRIEAGDGLLEWADVAGVRREAAKRARVTAQADSRTARDRFLVMQPSLDESWWKLWGGLDGPAGSLVDKVLTEAADNLPDLPDGLTTDTSWRKATALVETMISEEAPPAQVTVFVDAKHGVDSNGEAGVVLESGPMVGRQALEAIFCDATTEVVARAEDGRFMDYGRKHRTAPPALKRALLAKHNFVCQADGCDSANRLQVHHVVPWARGGATDQDNLVVLCWFHHHVVVHERGFQMYFTDHGRLRFRRPSAGPPSR